MATKTSLKIHCGEGTGSTKMYRRLKAYRGKEVRSDKIGFARFIKAIRIDNVAILPSCIEVVQEDFETIVSCCTMLKEFSIRHDEAYELPDLNLTPDVNMHAYTPTWTVTSQGSPIYQQLQHMRFTATLTARQLPMFHRLLARAVHLVSLMHDQHCDDDAERREEDLLPAHKFALPLPLQGRDHRVHDAKRENPTCTEHTRDVRDTLASRERSTKAVNVSRLTSQSPSSSCSTSCYFRSVSASWSLRSFPTS
ncbi:hypothetical protein C8Q74DRAFT_188968 [Fomes fomentarius]|nr:hypothetical protein C8Q74DRAFT_188968 [Fomes fomentarius]